MSSLSEIHNWTGLSLNAEEIMITNKFEESITKEAKNVDTINSHFIIHMFECDSDDDESLSLIFCLCPN